MMDGIACKLPGIISPLLNGAPEAAAPPHTIPNVTQISEHVKKLQLRLIVDGCRRAEHCLQPFPQGRELIYSMCTESGGAAGKQKSTKNIFTVNVNNQSNYLAPFHAEK